MQNRNPLITVITPSFNQGQFIERTIKSVLSQEGDFYLEYIVLDAGSTDGSVEIIRKYDRLLKEGGLPVKCLGIEYKWFSGPDKGQADAVNKGLKMASGEIIGWLNSDDTYCEGAIERIAKEFSKNPGVDIIYGKCNLIDRDDLPMGTFRVLPFNLNILSEQNVFMQPEGFFRKRLLEKIGSLNTDFYFCMDYEFWVRAAKYNAKVKHLPHFLADFRVHPDSKTSAKSLIGQIEALKISRRYFGQKRFAKKYLECCFGYAQKERCKIQEANAILKNELLKRNRNYLTHFPVIPSSSCLNAYFNLTKGLDETFTDKKQALKRILLAFKCYPPSLFNKWSVIIFLRVFMGKKLYFRFTKAWPISINRWIKNSGGINADIG